MKDRLDLVVGMNPSEMSNHNLEFFCPKAFIFHTFDEIKLRHMLEWQRRTVANSKASKLGFIMDDCMAETLGKGKKVMSSQDINRIFKNGRHFKFF